MISAMRRGVVEALREHKRQGRSVVVWDRETQRVVEVPPEEIVIPDLANEDESLSSKSEL